VRSSVRRHRRLAGFAVALLLGAVAGTLSQALSTGLATFAGLLVVIVMVAAVAPWALRTPVEAIRAVEPSIAPEYISGSVQVWRNGRILWAGAEYRPEQRPVGWTGSVYTVPQARYAEVWLASASGGAVVEARDRPVRADRVSA
jgi:hypothetical protein